MSSRGAGRPANGYRPWWTMAAPDASLETLLEFRTERLPSSQYQSTGFLRRSGQSRQVAHLPACTRAPLAVQVQLHRREPQRGSPIRSAIGPEIAKQICHRGGLQELRGTERQTADRPELLLEL